MESLLNNFSFQPTIIGISETKLKSHVSYSPQLPGYEFVNVNSVTNAGGVGVFINSNFTYKILSDVGLELDGCEDLWIVVDANIGNYKKLAIGVVYRHPGNEISKFQNKFENCIEKLNTKKLPYIICGDFNINLIDSDSSFNSFYLNALLSLGCTQFVNDFTRHSNDFSSKSLLDHIYSNLDLNCNIILSDISDHFPTFASYNLRRTSENSITIKHTRDMKHFNVSNFIKDVESEMKTFNQQLNLSPDELMCCFIKKFDEIVNLHAPLRRISNNEIKHKRKPWVNNYIIKLVKKKNKLFNRFVKNPTKKTQKSYTIVKNTVAQKIRSCKRNYYRRVFHSSRTDPKSMWKNVDKIIQSKNKKSNNIKTITDKNGKIITNPVEMSKVFNNHFSEIGKSIASSIPATTLSNNSTKIKPCLSSLFLQPVSPHEVEKIINSFDVNKSTPSFCTPFKFLKFASKQISLILSIIINKCMTEGIFPDCLKLAEVIPIHKKGSKDNLNHYRPISLLSPFSKIFEKCLYTRINSFFNKNSILFKSQFGFRDNSSTENAVLQIHDYLTKKIDEKETVCSIFIDLQKAFDTVDHSILLKKLFSYGIRGTTHNLLFSYLKNRHQFTLCNGSKSNSRTVECGVPQGSTLGPLLFLVYINDLFSSSLFNLNLFADDACLTLSNKCPQVLESQVNQELIKIMEWLCSNKLSLNIDKTKFLIFSSRSTSFNILINNKPIAQVSSINYLGVIIDNKLSWNMHVKHISNKVASGCWALFKLRPFVTDCILRKVYFAIVHQHLQYCISCWGGADKSKLKVLQNRCIRVISRASYRSKVSPLYKIFNTLQVNDLYEIQIAKIMYKINNNTWIGDFNLKKVESVHSHHTRSSTSSNYFHNSINKIRSLRAISNKGPRIWQSISNDTKNLSYHQFVKQLKTSVMDRY